MNRSSSASFGKAITSSRLSRGQSSSSIFSLVTSVTWQPFLLHSRIKSPPLKYVARQTTLRDRVWESEDILVNVYSVLRRATINLYRYVGHVPGQDGSRNFQPCFSRVLGYRSSEQVARSESGPAIYCTGSGSLNSFSPLRADVA